MKKSEDTSKRKLYVVGPATGYARWVNNHVLTNNMEDADIVMFTGGCDVDPSFYGRDRHPSTYSNIERDKEEIAAFKKAVELKIPLILGICRGFQLMNVMHGGILIQNVSNHGIGATHSMINNDEQYEINSLHHQMVYPWNIKDYSYEILYWADPWRSRYYEGISDKEIDAMTCEPEVAVYYTSPNTKCLGIQGHPEMLYYRDEYHPTLDMLNQLVDKYLYD